MKGFGCFDFIDVRDGRLEITGWSSGPAASIDEFRIELDGVPVASTGALERPDVLAAAPARTGWSTAGFEASIACEGAGLSDWVRIAAIARCQGADVATIDTAYVRDFAAGLPLPPARLRERICGSESEPYYWTSAVRSLGEFLDAYRAHADLASVRALLDWGCGCGRLTSLSARFLPHAAIHGCDIDEEAIAWCREHLAPSRFRAIPLRPPTDYEDTFLDLVLGYSVCSHLSRADQHAWLEELERLLVPGGLALLSVHGTFAAGSHHHSPETRAVIAEDLAREGISDRVPDVRLDGVAPEGYYLGVFQTPEWTREHWSRHFEVLEVRERAMAGYQDLVVLKKRG